MKFEGSGSKGTRVIERKRSVTDGQTDGRTARRTRQKQHVSPRGGRHDDNNAAFHNFLQTPPLPLQRPTRRNYRDPKYFIAVFKTIFFFP